MAICLVGICGGSGSGKTWLMNQLSTQLGMHCVCISLDDFYLDRSHLSPARRKLINFDNPRAIDWKLFEKALCLLISGKPAVIPSYDFSTHSRKPVGRRITAHSVIFVEGLWVWKSARARRLFHNRIYIDCAKPLRLTRRIQRDVLERGRTEESVRKQFLSHVQPMHQRYVDPLKNSAHVILQTPLSQFAVNNIVRQLCRFINVPGKIE